MAEKREGLCPPVGHLNSLTKKKQADKNRDLYRKKLSSLFKLSDQNIIKTISEFNLISDRLHQTYTYKAYN